MISEIFDKVTDIHNSILDRATTVRKEPQFIIGKTWRVFKAKLSEYMGWDIETFDRTYELAVNTYKFPVPRTSGDVYRGITYSLQVDVLEKWRTDFVEHIQMLGVLKR